MTADSDPQLDAEYRAFIRSMHNDTIATIVAVETWWKPDCFRIATLSGYVEDGQDSKDTADRIAEEWRRVIEPRLLTLIHGHPDPDVRFAADILDKRLWSAILILARPRSKPTYTEDENLVAVHLIHDGFARLRRAAYHAPWRANRPAPNYNGIPIGNAEPLPGKMLETIRALQEAGVLEKDSGLMKIATSDAVRRLSDILFMPDEQRAALFKENEVQDPIAEQPQPDKELKFGFTT
ncbi:hypothetical protein ACFWE3_10950 [Mycobacteriaceae bacterium NPDC060252]